MIFQPLGIAAWIMGNSALREIEQSGEFYTNRGNITAGRICGIIATILLIVFVILAIVIVIGFFSFWNDHMDRFPEFPNT